MIKHSVLILLAFLSWIAHSEAESRVLLVVGAAGTDEYGEMFAEWADRVVQVCEDADVELVDVARSGDEASPKSALKQAIREAPEADSLWIILIGHGTFDGKTARFNLRGPDVSAAELNEWLDPAPNPLAVVACFSSSGEFVNRLSSPGRVVVAATRSGFEHNFSRFGDYFTRSLTGLQGDLDKDLQVSLLEAYLFAARGVAEFYSSEGRLATEHALLDDNGDSKGTPADWFRGVHISQEAAENATDGEAAHQWRLAPSAQERGLSREALARRGELEHLLGTLRRQKDQLSPDSYYRQVEAIALELAEVYRLTGEPAAATQPDEKAATDSNPGPVETNEHTTGSDQREVDAGGS